MIDVNGHSLHVQVDGPRGAPWLVLSNSLGSTLAMWETQVRAFSKSYRVLRYDTRGHGRSDVPSGPYAVADLGRDVVALLDAFDVERAIFCGLSMGGATGMWLATHAAERIERLVLCNTTPWLGSPEILNARMAQVRREGLSALVEPTLERWFTAEFRSREPEAVDRIRRALGATPVAGYLACCEAIRDMDQREALPRIVTPTLVVAGTYDPTPPIDAARQWAATIPNVQFVELPAAHLSNVSAASAFNQSVLKFLQGRD